MDRRIHRVVATLVAVAVTPVAAVALAGWQPAAAGNATSQAATTCSLAPTSGTVVRTVGGDPEKSYRLRVPTGLPGPEAPLVVSLHGWLQTAANHETYTHLSPAADDNGFIVAYPQAHDFHWDQASRDITFVLEVVADIAATWCVDPQRVHVDGASNGGAMSQRMACEESDVVASVSSHIADDVTYLSTPCDPDRPISVLLTCGELAPCNQVDPRVQWADRNNCPPPVESTDEWGVVKHHQSCDAGTAVFYRSVAGFGHGYSGAVVDVVADEMWTFFSTHHLP